MTRTLIIGVAAIVLVGSSVPAAQAQPAAPTPQVTITGFIDTVMSVHRNDQDSLMGRSGDSEWYARNRGRFDVIGQLGRAKAVLGIEIDSIWGTTALTGGDNNLAAGGTAAQRNGSTSAFDLNTDTQGSMEVKWLYTEFPLPFMPFPTVVRLGAQPFAVMYKSTTYARDEFAGLNIDMNFTPNLKAHFTYAQIEENLTGSRRALGFGRGDDFAIVTSVEVTPIRGLDIRPLYSYVQLVGSTSASARVPVGGIGGTPAFTRSAIGGVGGLGMYEGRHTIGVDARWRSGPFSLEPTLLYQFGSRDTNNPFVGPGAGNAVTSADISAFLFDVIGGWRLGPLFLEARYMYSSGNRPKDQLSRDVNYFQPLNLDSGYWGAGWGEILSLGIDYFTGCIRAQCQSIGLDRYGRQQFAVRATYTVIPQLDIRAVVSPEWTAKAVDTDGVTAFANGGNAAAAITCATHTANSAANPQGAGCDGDSSYVGTEVNLGLTWRFAPGLAFDLVGAVLFTGSALDTSEVLNGVLTKREAKNAYKIATRIRYTF